MVPEDVQFVTEEYYPLNFEENGTLQGISVDLMERVLQKSGSGINRSSFRVLPWTEAFTLARTTPDTVIFTMTRTPERENQFLWAGPIFTDRDLLFTRAGVNLSSKSDIAALKVAVVKDDRSVNAVLKAGAAEKNLVVVLTAEEAVKLVDSGSADAFAYGEYSGQDTILKHAKNQSRFAERGEIGKNENYVAFNPRTPEQFVTAVNNSLQELRMNRGEDGSTDYEKILLKYLPPGCTGSGITDEQLIDLVQETIRGLKNDANGTLTKINAGESPFVDPADKDLYVYVFDTTVTLVGNGVNPGTVGTNYSGKPDAVGKMFRDDLTALALKDGKGWIEYVYSNPDSPGLYRSRSYVELCTGSDNARYIVGSGRYLNCTEINPDPQTEQPKPS
jgi:polar amino acid transport system substrate-binding protein